MTEHDPLLRDELVAAYLDGEATPAERAQVEADPDLLARAALLRQVSDMVAEPVLTAPPDVKRAHIAAALAASSTADNVTSLATRKRQMDWAKLGAVAAVIIAVLAVPIVLLGGGDDDDDTAASGDFAEFDDTAATDDGGGDAATQLESAARDMDSDTDTDDSASGDDGGESAAMGSGDDAAESEAMAEEEALLEEADPELAAPAPTPAPSDGDGAAEEAGDAEDDATAVDIGARRVDLPPVADAGGIGAVLGDAIADATASGDTRDTAELACADAFLDFIDQDPTFETVAGTVAVGGVPSEYIARLADPTAIVVYDDACNVVDQVFAAPVLTGG